MVPSAYGVFRDLTDRRSNFTCHWPKPAEISGVLIIDGLLVADGDGLLADRGWVVTNGG